MGFRSLSTWVAVAVLMAGCNLPVVEDGEQDTPVVESGEQEYDGPDLTVAEFCEQQSLERRFPIYLEEDVYPYPLEVSGTEEAPRLLNGGFEDASLAPEAVGYNHDPMHVYTGTGSASVLPPFFAAQFSGGGYAPELVGARTLSFWVYSAAGGPIDLVVEHGGETYQLVGGKGSYGFSDGGGGMVSTISTVEPHQWTLISVNLEGFTNCHNWLKIYPGSNESTPLYLDELQISEQ